MNTTHILPHASPSRPLRPTSTTTTTTTDTTTTTNATTANATITAMTNNTTTNGSDISASLSVNQRTEAIHHSLVENQSNHESNCVVEPLSIITPIQRSLRLNPPSPIITPSTFNDSVESSMGLSSSSHSIGERENQNIYQINPHTHAHNHTNTNTDTHTHTRAIVPVHGRVHVPVGSSGHRSSTPLKPVKTFLPGLSSPVTVTDLTALSPAKSLQSTLSSSSNPSTNTISPLTTLNQPSIGNPGLLYNDDGLNTLLSPIKGLSLKDQSQLSTSSSSSSSTSLLQALSPPRRSTVPSSSSTYSSSSADRLGMFGSQETHTSGGGGGDSHITRISFNVTHTLTSPERLLHLFDSVADTPTIPTTTLANITTSATLINHTEREGLYLTPSQTAPRHTVVDSISFSDMTGIQPTSLSTTSLDWQTSHIQSHSMNQSQHQSIGEDDVLVDETNQEDTHKEEHGVEKSSVDNDNIIAPVPQTTHDRTDEEAQRNETQRGIGQVNSMTRLLRLSHHSPSIDIATHTVESNMKGIPTPTLTSHTSTITRDDISSSTTSTPQLLPSHLPSHLQPRMTPTMGMSEMVRAVPVSRRGAPSMPSTMSNPMTTSTSLPLSKPRTPTIE